MNKGLLFALVGLLALIPVVLYALNIHGAAYAAVLNVLIIAGSLYLMFPARERA